MDAIASCYIGGAAAVLFTLVGAGLLAFTLRTLLRLKNEPEDPDSEAK